MTSFFFCAPVSNFKGYCRRTSFRLTIWKSMQGPSNLCPGYINVEGFGQDEDYESEEEIQYVTLDLGDVEPQLVPSSTTYRLIASSSSS